MQRTVNTGSFDSELKNIEKRRWQFWALTFLLIIIFSFTITGLSFWIETIPKNVPGLLNMSIIRISLIAITFAFCLYILEKELIFKKVSSHLIEEKVKNETLKQTSKNLKVLNAKLEKAIGQTKSMYKVAVNISKSIELEKLIDLILKNAINLVNAKSGVIMLENKGKLLPYKELNVDLKAECASHPGEKAYVTGKFVIANDLKKRFKRFADDYPDVKNAIAVPLVQGRRVLGSVCLFNKPADFNDQDKKLLITLANQATISLLNSRIFEQEKETVKKLKELDKLKNDFVASISHELKTPITAIKGYLEILIEEEAGKLNNQQHEFLGIINQSSDRLYDLISDLLDCARIESNTLKLQRSTIFLPLVIKKSIALMKPEIKNKHLHLITNIKENIPFVYADGYRIEQVMLNLLTNAVKFTDYNGKIVIECRKENSNILTSVSDSGIGINKTDQKLLFKKFFRSSTAINRSTPGTGLGLAVSKGIIKQHGGKIWIKSKTGVGSTFYFILPIKKQDSGCRH